MSSTNEKLKTLNYQHKGLEEFEAFSTDFLAALGAHPDKLDHVVLHGTMAPIKRAELRDRLMSLTKPNPAAATTTGAPATVPRYTDADIDTRIAEESAALNRTAFANLILCIGSAALKKRLNREAPHDAHEAFKKVAADFDTTDHETQDTRLANFRRARTRIVNEGISRLNRQSVASFCEKLDEANEMLVMPDPADPTKEVDDPAKYSSALMAQVILDAIGVLDATFVRNFKMTNPSVLRDAPKLKHKLTALLEDCDRMEDEAKEKQTRDALQAKVKALERENAAYRAGTVPARQSGAQQPGRNGQERAPPRQCADCGAPHTGDCIGKLIALGTITRDAGIAKFPAKYDVQHRTAMADAAVARYRAHQSAHQSGSPAPAPAPAPAASPAPAPAARGARPLAAVATVVPAPRAGGVTPLSIAAGGQPPLPEVFETATPDDDALRTDADIAEQFADMTGVARQPRTSPRTPRALPVCRIGAGVAILVAFVACVIAGAQSVSLSAVRAAALAPITVTGAHPSWAPLVGTAAPTPWTAPATGGVAAPVAPTTTTPNTDPTGEGEVCTDGATAWARWTHWLPVTTTRWVFHTPVLRIPGTRYVLRSIPVAPFGWMDIVCAHLCFACTTASLHLTSIAAASSLIAAVRYTVYMCVAAALYMATAHFVGRVARSVPRRLATTALAAALVVGAAAYGAYHGIPRDATIVDAKPAGVVAAPPDGSAVGAHATVTLAPGDTFRARNDPGADEHLFNTTAAFPDGWSPLEHPVYIRSANGALTPAQGRGTARVIQCNDDGDDVQVTYADALLVPDLAVSLVSERACWRKGVEMRFASYCHLEFPCGTLIKFSPVDHTCDMRVIEPTVCAALGGLTRGKSGGQREGLQVWGARLPISAERIRALPDVCADAPDILRKATAESTATIDKTRANAPRLPARTVDQPDRHLKRFGRHTAFDIWSPRGNLTSVAGGARYLIVFYDIGTHTITPMLCERKSDCVAALRRYIVENEGRHGNTFVGGDAYCDNEVVLNSSAMREILLNAGVTLRNSCAYEPWQNGGVERANRTLVSIAREMHARAGDADPVYWGYSMIQASTVHNRTCLVDIPQPDGTVLHKTPHELKTGNKPRIASLKPMFCTAMVRIPNAHRAHDIEPQALVCMHLGLSRYKPGHLFRVMEGPRAGDVITSSQAAWRELEYQGRTSTAVTVAGGADSAEGGLSPFDLAVDATPDGDLGWDVPPLLADPTPPSPVTGPAVAGAPAPTATRQTRHSGSTPLNVDYTKPVGRGASLAQTAYAMWAVCAATMHGDDGCRFDVAAYSSVVDGQHMPFPTDYVPRSYRDILSIPDPHLREEWLAAYHKETDGLIDGGTLVPVPRPAVPNGTRVLPLLTKFKIKVDGTKKVRDCLGGHLARPGLDFDRTFNATVHWHSIRSIIAVAAAEDLELCAADVTRAYTLAPTGPGEEWYCHIPDGYRDRPEYLDADGNLMVFRCGNLYGAPPAGRNWWHAATSGITTAGTQCGAHVTQSAADPGVFTVRRGTEVMHICLYVDDMLTAHTRNSTLRRDFMEQWNARFPTTDHGTEFQEFLGVHISPTADGYKVDSHRYITELVSRYLPHGVHGTYATPCDKDLVKLVQEASARKALPDADLLREYQSIAGSLQYVASTTRPDIAFAVGMLSRCVAWPNAELMRAALRVVIYLSQSSDIGITYQRTPRGALLNGAYAPSHGTTTDGLSDADWALARSTSGWCFFMSGAVVSYGSKKQQSISLSSCEAEIMASSLAACEAVFLRTLLYYLGHEQARPTELRMDNSGAIGLAHDPIAHASAKHIARRELHIRELIQTKEVAVKHIETDANIADIFTKPLDRKRFQLLRNVLMNIPP